MNVIDDIDILATYIDKMDDQRFLEECLDRGVTIFRQTMGYKTMQIHSKRYKTMRQLSLEKKINLKIMHDYPGAKTRLGNFDGVYDLNKYEYVYLNNDNKTFDVKDNKITLPVSFKDSVFSKIFVSHRLLMKDGDVELEVVETKDNILKCKINKADARVRFHSGINLPDTDVLVDCIAEKELEGLPISAKENPEFIALSFVNSKDDIIKARQIIRDSNPKNTSKIIAKIESKQGVDNIDEILREVDGIMVARGDLALQISFEEIGLIQTILMAKAKKKNKIAIVATQMVDSIKSSKLPLRAEIIDVTNAILQGSYSVWLSPELAHSDNYFEALAMLKKVVNKVKYYR